METKHTPGKLVVQDGAEFAYLLNNENVVANLPKFGAGVIEAGQTAPWHCTKENAARLAHCWNCHDDLLAALEAIVETTTATMTEAEMLEHDLDNHEPEDCSLCQARAAIAKAKGK